MPGVKIAGHPVLLWNQLELLYSIHKEIGTGAPWGPIFVKILLFVLLKKN